MKNKRERLFLQSSKLHITRLNKEEMHTQHTHTHTHTHTCTYHIKIEQVKTETREL